MFRIYSKRRLDLPTLINFLSGNHWAVESEIFWKARGDYGLRTEAAIACVFKKFMRRLPDGTTQVSGWSATVTKPTLQWASGKRVEILQIS
jgi:hypothetical protein